MVNTSDWARGTTCYYQPAVEGNNILCIFERPTKLEIDAGRPVVGDTGEHLCLLLENMRSEKANDTTRMDFCSHRIGILDVATVPLGDDEIANGKDAYSLSIEQVDAYRARFETRPDVKHALQRADYVFCFGGLAANMFPSIKKMIGNRRVKRIAINHLSGSATSWHTGNTWDEKMRNLSNQIIAAIKSDDDEINLRKNILR